MNFYIPYMLLGIALFGQASSNPSTTSSPSQEITMSIIPSDIKQGLTKNAELNCTFRPNSNTNFQLLISMIVSKSDTGEVYNELAAITTASHDASVKDALGANVTGEITNNGMSYINFKWKYPSDALIGNFKCSANGIDSFGHPVVAKTTADGTEKSINQDTLLDKMKRLEQALDQTKAQLIDQKNQADQTNARLDQQKTQLDKLNLTNVQLTTRLDEQKTQVEKQSVSIKNYTSVINSLTSRVNNGLNGIMIASRTYNGSTYHLSRPYYPSTDEFRDIICRLFGGHQAEIDDSNEFDFIAKFVTDTATGSYVYISGTDLGHEGTWKHERSDELLRYTKWGPGHPTSNTDYNCIYLYRGYGWKMIDGRCTWPLDIHFLCETKP